MSLTGTIRNEEASVNIPLWGGEELIIGAQ